MTRFFQKIHILFFEEQARHFLWLPVFCGTGIGLYFWRSSPLTEAEFMCVASLALIGIVLSFFRCLRLWMLPFCVLGVGIVAVHLHTLYAGTPMLRKNLMSPQFQGEIEEIDFTEKGRRLKIKALFLDTLPRDSWPKAVRVTIRGNENLDLQVGDRLKGPLKLFPVLQATTPDGFNFRRKAYFEHIGAQGHFLKPPEILQKPQGYFTYMLETARQKITTQLHAALPGQTGAIASAFITGQTAKINDETRQHFANSGTSHFLAIAGLHFNLMAMTIFITLRLILSLMPFVLLRWNVKKISAVLTLTGLFLYLQISGHAIPCQRAFIMAMFVTTAIVLDRLSISLRALAIAAWIIMMVSPSVVVTPSFHLSFAAVMALIVVYEQRDHFKWLWHKASDPFLKKAKSYALASLFTTVIAGTAVIPFTMLHFHQLTLQSILANFLGIPIMACWIMPLLFVGILLMPMGLDFYPFFWAGYGVDLLHFLAATVGSLPGGCIYVVHPPLLAMVMLSLGALWLSIWKTPWRLWGLPVLMLGATWSFFGVRPDFLVSHEGKEYGFYKGDVLVYSGKKTATFLSKNWATYGGCDPHKILGINASETEDYKIFMVKGTSVAILEKDFSPFRRCPQADVVIAQEALKKKGFTCKAAKVFLDYFDLRYNGPYVFYMMKDGNFRMLSRKKFQGHWPWS